MFGIVVALQGTELGLFSDRRRGPCEESVSTSASHRSYFSLLQPHGMRFTESRRGQDYAKPRLVLSRRREQARGLHANEQSTRASFYRKDGARFWLARIAARFGGRTRPGDSIRICE